MIFAPLVPLSYDLIVADPPWSFENYSAAGERKNAKAQYRCMSLDEIKRLPVGHLARPDCLLMLWATNPLVDVAFEVMKAWDFRFRTAGHWVKKTKNGCLGFGTGYILRTAGEPFLIGTIGKPVTTRSGSRAGALQEAGGSLPMGRSVDAKRAAGRSVQPSRAARMGVVGGVRSAHSDRTLALAVRSPRSPSISMTTPLTDVAPARAASASMADSSEGRVG
jgi:MT-A70